MPYVIRKLPKQDLYRVYNAKTKEVHSYGTTLENAKKQITLLNMIDAGVPLKKQGKGCCPDDCECMECMMEGGTIAEDDKVLKPFINRIGSKVSLLRDIIPIIPPHKTYVEAFAGGGSIFWNKEPAEKSVLNDLDKDVVQSYKDIKKVPLNADLNMLDDKPLASVQAFIDKVNSKSSPRDRLIKLYKMSKGTFNAKGEGKLYKNVPMSIVAKNLQKYKDLLKHTTITNKDYEKVVREYDSPDTFFLLDPPYEESEVLYKDGVIDYEKMRDLLKSIKGKFLLTINDSKYIRDVFKGFNQKKVSVTNVSNSPYLETKGRKELFISNYPLKKQGKGVETDLFDNKNLGQPVSIPEINSIDVTLPTYMYKRLPDIKTKDGKTKPPPYRFRLVTPTTKARNLASRMKQNVVNLERKPVATPSADIEPQVLGELPKLKEFSPADRKKIDEYYKQVKREEAKDKKDIPNQPANNLPRGFPLPCDNPRPKKIKAPKEKKPVGRPKVDKPPKEKKPRGRPKKQPKQIQLQGEDDENVIINPEVEFPEGSSSKSSSSKSSKTKSTSSSETSVSSAKFSESSKASSKSKKTPPPSVRPPSAPSVTSSINLSDVSFDPDEDVVEEADDFFSRIKKGKGIENKISNKSIGMNSWVQHCKNFAAKKGIKYNEALKDPECKATYKKGEGLVTDVKKAVKSASKKVGLGKCGMGIVDEAAAAGYADQVLIADAYNQTQLGAKKKYISL